jgi:hypothetical protein
MAANGNLVLGGDGVVVEWALRMNRFSADAELSCIARSGRFSDDLAAKLGMQIAHYHQAASVNSTYTPSILIDEILQELDTEFQPMTDVLSLDLLEVFRTKAQAAFTACSALLDARGNIGHVRRGHGDLHLHNIVYLGGMPVLFDALEFDEKLGTMDVLYDLAFLIMDMLHSNLRSGANVVLNNYLYHAGSIEHLTGLAALPLFLSMRAAIRAMVAVQTGRRSIDKAGTCKIEAVEYLRDALTYLNPPPPQLIGVGGFSGTGKTTLSARLAAEIGAAPGALHLRTDLERKALWGVGEFTPLPPSAYGKDTNRVVYASLLQKAGAALSAGHSVILDAVHLNRAERDSARELAASMDVPFTGLWLEADAGVLEDRVAKRTGDASDADVSVLHLQMDNEIGVMDWNKLNTTKGVERTLVRARKMIMDGKEDG